MSYLMPCTREEFSNKPSYKKITNVAEFTEQLKSQTGLELREVKALGLKVTGSERAVSASDGTKVASFKVKSTNGDLRILQGILRAVTKASRNSVKFIANIAAFPIRDTKQQCLKDLFKERGVNRTHSKRGEYYLANYGGKGKIFRLREMFDSTGKSWSITDEYGKFNSNRSKRVPFIDGEVINDTVITAYSAATILSKSKKSIRNVDGLILGTGMNIGQCRNWDAATLKFAKTNNLEFGQQDLRAGKIFSKFIKGSVYEAAYNKIHQKDKTKVIALETFFAGGQDKGSNGNAPLIFGIRAVLQELKERIQANPNAKQEAIIDLFTRLNLKPDESILLKNLDKKLPTNIEITNAAKKGDQLAIKLLEDKYSRLAQIYRSLHPIPAKGQGYYFAASGSVVVDDLTSLESVRKAFCKALGIKENQLFMHQLGALDGMDLMVKERAALARVTA